MKQRQEEEKKSRRDEELKQRREAEVRKKKEEEERKQKEREKEGSWTVGAHINVTVMVPSLSVLRLLYL